VAIIMILALLFHVFRGEGSVIWIHTILAALALFVAWGRWRKAPIPAR
jgi:putative oxidoreductase